MENAHRIEGGNRRKKGQMSMLVFVLGVVFFIMLGIFLFTSGIKSSDTDYTNMYVHNLLLSAMRTSTGYPNPCISVSDTLSCAYLTPDRICGSMKCSEIVEEVTKKAIESSLKQNYDYYLVVEPENWDIVGGSVISMGNEEAAKKRPRFVANEKVLAFGSNLRIKLTISGK